MKEQIKKLICAALACACIAPAGAVGVLADDNGRVISSYSFERDASNNQYLISDDFTTQGGTMNQGTTEKATGIGSNKTGCVKITVEDNGNANFYDLTRGGTNDGQKNDNGNYLKVLNPENKYVRVDAKIYVTDDGFEGIYFGNNYGSKISGGIKKSDLYLNAWNDVTFVSTFTRKSEGVPTDNYILYTAETDLVANGVLIGHSTNEIKNSKYHQLVSLGKTVTADDEDRMYLTLLLNSDGNDFTAYLDDVKTTAYAKNNFVFGTKINTWSFENNPTSRTDGNYSWIDDRSWVGGLFVGSTVSAVKNVKGNTTQTAKIVASDTSRFQPINAYRYNGAGDEQTLDMYDTTTNPYQVTTFDVYVEQGEKLSLGLANTYSSKCTPVIPVTAFDSEKWNTVAILTKLTNKSYEKDDSSAVTKVWFDVVTDIYVNGVLINDQTVTHAYNSLYQTKLTEDSEDRFNMNLFFFTEEMNPYTVYLDDLKVVQKYGDMKSEAEFLLDATKVEPKLVANDVSTVSGDTVTVIAGTKASQLTADTEVEMTVTRESETVDNDQALEEGDEIEIVRADNSDVFKTYTVAVAEKKLLAPTYYVSYSNGSSWLTYYDKLNYDKIKGQELLATKYCFPATVYNTTGEKVKVCTIWGLYESDGSLVDASLSYTDVPSSFTEASVRLDYTVTNEQLKTGRYLKAMLFDSANFKPIVHGKK